VLSLSFLGGLACERRVGQGVFGFSGSILGGFGVCVVGGSFCSCLLLSVGFLCSLVWVLLSLLSSRWCALVCTGWVTVLCLFLSLFVILGRGVRVFLQKHPCHGRCVGKPLPGGGSGSRTPRI